jgi:phytoene dehydrogenase-like protein
VDAARRVKRAVVVGSGPNGLAAAVKLALGGVHVTVHEAGDSIGGGCRTAELTLPGFRHDVCAAVLPLARRSPAFSGLELEWIDPPLPAAHALDGDAVTLERTLQHTADGLGADAQNYRALVEPFVRAWPKCWSRRDVLRLRPSLVRGLLSTRAIGRLFTTERARALFAGNAAHSAVPLERAGSAGFGFVLSAAAHVDGWALLRGGSQTLVDALAARLSSLGGEIVTSSTVDELPRADVVLCDLAPREFARIAGLTDYASSFQQAPGAFKLDWALDGPIPWASEACGRAGTVHLGGPFAEIADSERAPWEGRAPGARPFVILTQPSLFDLSRAPNGKHTVWAYCHVPTGWEGDATEAIEGQVERFAPGFRNLILARHVMTPRDFEAYNRNDVGGDVVGGANTLRQLIARPTLQALPWRTPLRGVYLCSASTPPGGGVHGLCGLAAARVALRDLGRSPM